MEMYNNFVTNIKSMGNINVGASNMMAEFSPIVDGMSQSFSSGNVVIGWLIKILIVVAVILIGIFFAKILAKIACTVVRRAKIDKAFTSLGWSEQLNKIGVETKPSVVIGWLVKWFVLIAVFSGIVNYLGAQQLSDFLNDILAYLPNVIIAVVIVIAGSLIANFVRTAVAGLLKSAQNVTNKGLVANVPYYAIMTITILTALNHLGVGGNMIEILFTGIVLALSIGLGLAFGLGGREYASRVLDKLLKK